MKIIDKDTEFKIHGYDPVESILIPDKPIIDFGTFIEDLEIDKRKYFLGPATKEEVISNVCTSLKTKEDGLAQKVTSLIEENKSLSKELHDMKTKMSLQAIDSVLDSKVDVNGVNLVTTKFEGMDMNTLKEVADNLRDKLVSGVVVLANVADDKLNLVATATKDAVDKGVHCGNIVKEIAQIAGGKGGGRPNMAQAGAPDVSKVDEALNHASEVLKSQIK
jgi:alanyl-tRNA synthetase